MLPSQLPPSYQSEVTKLKAQKRCTQPAVVSWYELACAQNGIFPLYFSLFFMSSFCFLFTTIQNDQPIFALVYLPVETVVKTLFSQHCFSVLNKISNMNFPVYKLLNKIDACIMHTDLLCFTQLKILILTTLVTFSNFDYRFCKYLASYKRD